MKKNRQMNRSIAILMVIFLLSFVSISGRFIHIQATGEVDDVSLTDWANDKRETEIVLPAERGKIYDQNGVTLAYNRPIYRIYAVLNSEFSKNKKEPQHVVDPNKTAKKLAPLLDIDEKEIKKIINNGIKKEKWQVEFGKRGKNLSQQE